MPGGDFGWEWDLDLVLCPCRLATANIRNAGDIYASWQPNHKPFRRYS